MASGFANFIQCRTICSSIVMLGKRNFRKFNLYGKRGTPLFKSRYFGKDPQRQFKRDKLLEYQYDRGCRPTGIKNENGKYQPIPEMIPELIVPNLSGFTLKPYVSYRVPDVIQDEFTPQDLFYAIYSKKISEDFNNGKLNEDFSSKEPSKQERLTAEDSRQKALSTGSDIPYYWEFPK